MKKIKKEKKKHIVMRILDGVVSGVMMVWICLSLFVQGTMVMEYFGGNNQVQISPGDPISISISTQEEKLDEKDFVGKCESVDMQASVGVYLKVLRPGLNGQFYTQGGNPIIVLSKVSSISYQNLVSHEVSHFVDALVSAKGINDGETRAYLQGYFTDCVYKLIDKKN